MAAAPRFKIYNSYSKEYVGCVKHLFDAAVLLCINSSYEVRDGHSAKRRLATSDECDSDSYDATTDLLWDRCAELNKPHSNNWRRRRKTND